MPRRRPHMGERPLAPGLTNQAATERGSKTHGSKDRWSRGDENRI